MTKSTRNLLVLVGAVTILSLALFAVGPVLAQTGTGGTNGQGGNTVVVSPSDTLGTLVARYNLTGSNLRDFLSMNANLPLVPGQRVTFPQGVTVNIPTTGQSSSGQGSSSSSSQSQGTTSTNTPVATAAATVASTGTPAATKAANNSSSGGTSNGASGSTSNGASGSSSNGASANANTSAQTVNTYVVKQGDTLGTVLNAMGFTVGAGSTSGATVATATTAATTAATVAPTATTAATVAPTATSAATVAATGTPAATTAASTAATATPMATVAATVTTMATVAATNTPMATVASTSTPVATTAASSSNSSSSSSTTAGGPTDAQLTQFVRLNSTLRFGVVVSLPAGIPATGNNQGSTGANGTSGTSGSNGTNGTSGSNGTNGSSNANGSSSGAVTNRLSSMSGQAAANVACSTNAPKGFGYYKIRGGDSLQSLSKTFGVPVSTILSMNRGSAFAKGDIILLPGAEAPGHWNIKEMCPNGTSSNNSNTTTNSNGSSK